MNLLFWGLTVSLIGKVLLAAGVLMAHSKIAHEMKIDQAVIHSFKVEQMITVLGLLLILFGYFLEIYFYGFTPLLTCSGAECAAALLGA
jgi:hypothetical protein